MIKRMILGLIAVLACVAATLWMLPQLNPKFAVTSWRVLASAAFGFSAPESAAAGIDQALEVPAGYALNLYASDVPKARFMRLTPAGDLLVSQPRLGQVSLLMRDANGDGRADGRRVLIGGLDRPHGIEIADGWLYVAESGAVGRIRFDAGSGATSGIIERILASVPAGANHWTRTLRRGPDGWFYLSIGSTCNACEEEHPWRATMLRFRGDGSGAEVFATGLRNSVGFDWAPWDGGLYATDNGRDLLGDDFPPCELNRIEAGGFYGWPYVNGFGAKDPDLGDRRPELASKAINPAHGFRAHNAPLGISFLRHSTNVAMFGRSALVALHGSWNRSSPDGYKVVRLNWGADGRISEHDFVRGFERAGKVIGRPVDVVEAPDGEIFISDDYAGAVYRVVRSNATRAVADPTRASGAGAEAFTAIARREIAALTDAQRAAANERARALMARHGCSTCHAPGTPLLGRWSTLAERYSLAALRDFFLAPTPPMPAFSLGVEEREALAVHLLERSLAQ